MLDDVLLAVVSCSCWGAVLAVPVLTHVVRYSPDPTTTAALFLGVGWSVINFVTTGALFARSSTFKPSLAYAAGLPLFWLVAFILWRPLGASGVAIARLLMESFVFVVLVNGGASAVKMGLQRRTIVALYAATSVAVGGALSHHAAAFITLAGVLSAIGALASFRVRIAAGRALTIARPESTSSLNAYGGDL